MRDQDVRTRDGRRLVVREDGDPGGKAVLTHAGTPNSRLMYHEDVEKARARGVRLISYDRPGYGGSERQEGRTVADCVQDVRDIARALDIDRLGVWGVSGGGPHAIACAALAPDLVPAVGVLASPAPWDAEGLDQFEGMGELNAEDTQLYFEDRQAAREKCERDRQEMLEATLPEMMEFMASLLAPVDATVLDGEFGQFLLDSLHAGLEPGSDGWWDDGVAMLEPWGFDLSAISTPVLLLHGRHDRFVPFSHGEWLARHIPTAESRLLEEDGHLTLTAHHLDEVHDWLLGHL